MHVYLQISETLERAQRGWDGTAEPVFSKRPDEVCCRGEQRILKHKDLKKTRVKSGRTAQSRLQSAELAGGKWQQQAAPGPPPGHLQRCEMCEVSNAVWNDPL